MLGRHVGAQLAAARDDPKRACERVWGSALPLLRGGLAAPGAAQLNAGNLETAITDRTEKYPDKVRRRAMSRAPQQGGAAGDVPFAT